MVVLETKTVDGTTIAILKRENRFEPFIVAWAYNEENVTWGQGHYFSNISSAVKCYDEY